MAPQIGVLSSDSELLDSMKTAVSGVEITRYRSPDMVRPEIDLLVVDIDIFEELESEQFFLSKIRKKIHNLPVLLVLKPSNREKLDFDWFFTDFIFYPFRKGEMEYRIKRHVSFHLEEQETEITVGRVRINLIEYSVYHDGEKIDFTYKEFELLRLLVQNRGQVFTRKELLSRIWGMEYIGGTRTVDVHIRRLRSKLGDDFNALIETIRNVGYRCIK